MKNAAMKAAFRRKRVLLLLVFALLIGNAAAGLASGLARGLAFTAAAILGAGAEVLGFQSLNLHCDSLQTIRFLSVVYHKKNGKSIQFEEKLDSWGN